MQWNNGHSAINDRDMHINIGIVVMGGIGDVSLAVIGYCYLDE